MRQGELSKHFDHLCSLSTLERASDDIRVVIPMMIKNNNTFFFLIHYEIPHSHDALHRSSVEFQRELKKKKVLLFFIIIGMTTRMSSDALSKVEREHRWSKCFDNSP